MKKNKKIYKVVDRISELPEFKIISSNDKIPTGWFSTYKEAYNVFKKAKIENNIIKRSDFSFGEELIFGINFNYVFIKKTKNVYNLFCILEEYIPCDNLRFKENKIKNLVINEIINRFCYTDFLIYLLNFVSISETKEKIANLIYDKFKKDVDLVDLYDIEKVIFHLKEEEKTKILREYYYSHEQISPCEL